MEMIWVQHSPVPYTLPGPPPRHPQTGPTHCSSLEEPQKGQKPPPRRHSSQTAPPQVGQDVNVGIQQSQHGPGIHSTSASTAPRMHRTEAPARRRSSLARTTPPQPVQGSAQVQLPCCHSLHSSKNSCIVMPSRHRASRTRVPWAWSGMSCARVTPEAFFSQRKEFKSLLPSMVSLPQRLSCVTCFGQNSRLGPNAHERKLETSPSGVASHTW